MLTFICLSCKQINKKLIPEQVLQQSSESIHQLFPYDLTQFEKHELPDILTEVSGIYYFLSDSIPYLLLQQDEDGIIFKYNLSNNTINQSNFNQKGDYEDITQLGDYIYLLRSDGNIYVFNKNDLEKASTTPYQIIKHLLPKAEYEGLYADSLTNKLIVLTKESKLSLDQHQTPIYEIDITGNEPIMTNNRMLSSKEIANSIGKKKMNFKPSAIALHPILKHWYILSSVNQLIAVYNQDWELLETISLSKNTFLQPEGITFDHNGNLYISSEGDKIQKGYFLKFNYIASKALK